MSETPVDQLMDAYDDLVARYGANSLIPLAFRAHFADHPAFVEYAEAVERAAANPPGERPPVMVEVDLSGPAISTGDWATVDDVWRDAMPAAAPAPPAASEPAPPPKRWAYQVMPFGGGGVGGRPDGTIMNQLGLDGWEAFAAGKSFVLFRRPVP